MRPEREEGELGEVRRGLERKERGWVLVSSDLYRPWTGQRQVQTGPAWYRRTRRVSSGRGKRPRPVQKGWARRCGPTPLYVKEEAGSKDRPLRCGEKQRAVSVVVENSDGETGARRRRERVSAIECDRMRSNSIDVRSLCNRTRLPSPPRQRPTAPPFLPRPRRPSASRPRKPRTMSLVAKSPDSSTSILHTHEPGQSTAGPSSALLVRSADLVYQLLSCRPSQTKLVSPPWDLLVDRQRGARPPGPDKPVVPTRFLI